MRKCTACKHEYEGGSWTCPRCEVAPESVDGFLLFSRELAESEGNIDPVHFEKVAEVEPKNFWYRSRNRLILWALEKYFPRIESFFEIGCGSGYVLSGVGSSMPHLSLYGSDLSVAGLNFAKERVEKATLLQMDARNIPFTNEFDVIGAFDVLEHIEDDEQVLAQMFSAVRTGGGIVITVPQHKFLWGPMDEYSCHVRRYAADDLKRAVSNVGFRVIRCTSFVSALLPMMILSRLLFRGKIDEKGDLPPGLKIGRPLNYIFEKIMSVEAKAVDMGVDMPAGGSLLLVASKD